MPLKVKLTDLNEHLFAQIERLSDENLPSDKIENEIKRGMAIAALADQVTRGFMLKIHAARIVSDHAGSDPSKYLTDLEGKSEDRQLTVVKNGTHR